MNRLVHTQPSHFVVHVEKPSVLSMHVYELQEYDTLRRAAAEKSALELKLEAQSKYYAQVPREELAELQVWSDSASYVSCACYLCRKVNSSQQGTFQMIHVHTNPPSAH
jgi:hypothetical protein